MDSFLSWVGMAAFMDEESMQQREDLMVEEQLQLADSLASHLIIPD